MRSAGAPRGACPVSGTPGKLFCASRSTKGAEEPSLGTFPGCSGQVQFHAAL